MDIGCCFYIGTKVLLAAIRGRISVSLINPIYQTICFHS